MTLSDLQVLFRIHSNLRSLCRRFFGPELTPLPARLRDPEFHNPTQPLTTLISPR